MDVHLTDEIRASILAGIVLAIRASEGNPDFLRGALAAFQHQALSFGIGWTALVRDAKQALRDEMGE